MVIAMKETNQETPSKIVTLQWLPSLIKPKTSKGFRKSGYKDVCKSCANLRTILCSKNKKQTKGSN